MKIKPIIYAVVSLLVIVGLVAYGYGEISLKKVEKTLEEAKEINSNSYLGNIQVLLEEQGDRHYHIDDLSTFDMTHDEYVIGYFSCYPYKTDSKRMTMIGIKGGDYHLFGIKLGDKIDNAADILKQKGYKKKKTTVIREGISAERFKKHDITIEFHTEVGSYTISEIWLTIDTHMRTNPFVQRKL